MREDTMHLIEDAKRALTQVERLIAAEDWASRDTFDGFKQGIRQANINAALEAVGKAWVSEATAPDAGVGRS